MQAIEHRFSHLTLSRRLRKLAIKLHVSDLMNLFHFLYTIAVRKQIEKEDAWIQQNKNFAKILWLMSK